MKKKYITFLTIFLSSILLCSCGKDTGDSTEISEVNPVVEVAQNDWSGGFSRLAQIQSDVMNVVSILDTHNYDVIMGNPTDYWDEDEFYYLHFIPVDSDMMLSTLYINEIDDQTVMEQNVIANLTALGYENAGFKKIDKNEYMIQYDGYFTDRQSYEDYAGNRTIRCVYDATHNWMQAVSTILNVSTLYQQEDSFYEFAEIDGGKYAFQNESERMYVEYNENGELKMFSYSQLMDPPVQSDYEEEFNEQEEQTLEEFILDITQQDNTEQEIGGDQKDEEETIISEEQETTEELSPDTSEEYGFFYTSAENSIFTHMIAICPEWVEAANNSKTLISYQDGVLSVSIQNKLSGQIERFSVTKQEEKIDEPVQELSEQEEG